MKKLMYIFFFTENGWGKSYPEITFFGHFCTKMTTSRSYFYIHSCYYMIGWDVKFYNMKENVWEVIVFLA